MRKNGKTRKRVAVVMVAILLLTVITPNYVYVANAAEETSKENGTSLSEPRVEQDTNLDSGQKVTWDCIWFGSYPQAEVIPSDIEYTVFYETECVKDGDVIIDDTVYNSLKNATGWDANGDIILNGEKYRRLREQDSIIWGKGPGMYEWGWNWGLEDIAVDDVDDFDAYYEEVSQNTYQYFKYEPIKWRVLSIDDDKVLLLSDLILDQKFFNIDGEQSWEGNVPTATWETSTVRSWLNGYDSKANTYGVDFSNSSFLKSAFSEEEQQAMIANESDSVFLLADSETEKYGFAENTVNDEARRCRSSLYAKARGAETDVYEGTLASTWFLKATGGNSSKIVLVGEAGNVDVGKYDWEYLISGVRVALNLDLSKSDLYSYAGTVSSDEMKAVPLPQEDEEYNLPAEKGTVLNISGKNCKVKVTSSSESSPTVAYVGTTKSSATSVTIPATVKADGITYKVTSVAASAFSGKKKLAKVTVGKNVKTIGKNAFKNCTKLKSIVIKSSSIKSVGKNALKGTNKKLVVKAPAKKVTAYKKLLKGKGNSTLTVKK